MSSSFGFLSTYPPTQCGLASFTASLVEHLVSPGSGDSAGVVRLVDSWEPQTHPEVVHHLSTSAPRGHLAAAEILNRYEVAIIQHEYGIFGGTDGDQVLAVLDRVRVPVVVVLHTVLAAPTPSQRFVLEQVTGAAAAVVTMTETAVRRLLAGYHVDPAKVSVIPHGAPKPVPSRSRAPGPRPTILTWGLLGPGKGIEWAIAALRSVRRLDPPPRYIVAGQTHPKVLEREGERYRESLAADARALGVDALVRFEPGYRDAAGLRRLVRQADVVLLPYDSYEQVTSGVLIEAVASGKPIVSTCFPHAAELLSSGAGLLVPHRDPGALGTALRRVLTEPGLAEAMVAEAARLAPGLYWPAVADRYRGLVAGLLTSPTGVVG